MSDQFKKNILSRENWLRILYVVFFAVICWVLGVVMTVLVVAQILFSLLSGRDNENLRQVGSSLSLYFYQILLFLCYKSDAKPFPFTPLPGPEPPPGYRDPEDPDLQPRADATVHEPAAPADFASEHEPEAAGSGPVAGAAGDDVFADISFTEEKKRARAGGGPPPQSPPSSAPPEAPPTSAPPAGGEARPEDGAAPKSGQASSPSSGATGQGRDDRT